ncbi:CotO family spore coat protein [Mangrovibacillus cuniculi]|uniref:Uncharacterized protein n=1 Tax=Mangrovibacillus cuniculi TaxID=2593652 RepID=A0A7S8C9X4_9BACI|nr:CotO family spore coat protein [Mangrovibacillus cuniculi]QPC46094.1 hypothetical protein G8O30_03530 [Mangrovibacillus cuniculi]
MQKPFILSNKQEPLKASMQQLYSSKEVRALVVEDLTEPKSDEASTIVDHVEQKDNNIGFGLKRLKPFKEMSTKERLDYLETFIGKKVPFPCEFYTDERVAKGIIESVDSDNIYVKEFDNLLVKLKKREVTAVKIIGFV